MAEAHHNYNHRYNDAGAEIEIEDEGSSSIIHEIPLEKEEALKEEAIQVEKLFDKFEEEFTQGKSSSFYILSQKWLNQWKRNVSYENVIKDLEPNRKWFGQISLGRMNEDIIEENPKLIIPPNYPEDESFTNILLKDGIQEGRDYKLITQETWEYFSNRYDSGIAIKRPVKTLANGEKRVEVRLKQIQIIPVNHAFLRSVDHEKAQEFGVFILQTTSTRKIKEIQSDLINICNSEFAKKLFAAPSPLYYSFSMYAEDTLRLWKLNPSTTLSEKFSYLRGKCKQSNTYDYRIPFKGTYLMKNLEETLEDAEIAENDYVFIEVRENGKGWSFTGDGVPEIDKCEFCQKFETLPVVCGCKKVAYCSQECKINDKKYHERKCDKAQEEEEEQQRSLGLTHGSKRGLCGLQNLGNTCFMNSGLQCLSNIFELTHYFISDNYEKEVNESNPLGTKGKLAKKYATFLKNLWYGNGSVHSPWALKHAISEFQPMFSGYQQHDSQELLAFLLDGLHEDLNRVQQKPFTEIIESSTQPDYEVGLKSWENHLKRNQSIIVDLLHGQFKSKITCPTCDRVSITFDPFNSVSLPIPAKKEKEIDFYFFHVNNREKPTKLSVRFPTSTHTAAQLREETAKLLNKDPRLFYFAFSNHHSKEIVKDEANTLTNTLRKKKKSKPLFAFEITEEECNADPNTYVQVDYQTTRKIMDYFGRPSRRKFTFLKGVFLRKDMTAKDVYSKIFQQFRMLWDEFIPEGEKEAWKSLSNEQAFAKVWEHEEKPFKIYLVTNARIFHQCFFCGEKRCENCELNYDSPLTVQDLLTKIKDPEFELELEVFFTGVPAGLDYELLNSYTDITKTMETEEKKEKDIHIYQCFEQFEEPEILGEENTWYCSRCKEHKRAIKKMEIYKAPPILMVHLKRFKSEGNSILSKSKISAQVDFPLESLNISQFVANHEFPMDYPLEKIPPGFLQGNHTNGQMANGHTLNGQSNLFTQENIQESNFNYEEAKMEILDHTPPDDGAEKMQVEGTSNSLLYDLFAVVNHYGNIGFGHYTAYAKNHLKNRWFCFDDSSVTEEDSTSVCSPASYVLFYKRKNWVFKH